MLTLLRFLLAETT